MALPVYNTGLAQVTLGSRLVTFSGGASLTAVDPTTGVTVGIAGPGDLFFYGNIDMGVVMRVVSATQLELFLPWRGLVQQSPIGFTIVRQSVPLIGSAAALAQSIQTLGQDSNPVTSLTADNGVSRLKARFAADGTPEIATGASGTGDSSLVPGLQFDKVGGFAKFPNGVKSAAPGLKNRLINGSFEIWNTGTQFTVADGTASTITADRWIVDNHSGSSASVFKFSAAAAFRTRSAIRIVTTAASVGGYLGVTQIINSYDCSDLDGSAVTISFDINASTTAGSLTGKLSVFANAGLDDNSFSKSIFNGSFALLAPGKVAVTVPASATSGIKNGARVFIGVAQASASGSITAIIGTAQVQKGSIADDFEYRPIELEETLLGTDYNPTFHPPANFAPTLNGDVTLSKPADNRLQWQVMDSGGIIHKIDVSNQVSRNEQVGGYTLTSSDANGVMIVMNSTTAVTLVIPKDLLPVGTIVPVYVKGIGQVTVAPGSGVTIHTPSTLTSRTRYAMLSLYQDAANEWVLSGDIT